MLALQRFRDIALERSKIAIFGYLAFNPPTQGFPWDNLRKIFTQMSEMAKVPNSVKIAENFNRLSSSHGRCGRQTTDDRRTADDI